MAIEYYSSLPGVQNPASTLKSVNAQLEPYRQYLERAEKAAHEYALSLVWREPDDQERQELQSRLKDRFTKKLRPNPSKRRRDRQRDSKIYGGCWIILEPHPDNGEEPESTFIAFGDTKAIYDQPPEKKSWKPNAEITVNDYDAEAQAVLLSRRPDPIEQNGEAANDSATIKQLVFLRPNTWSLQCQANAIDELKDRPYTQRGPLVRLSTPRTTWPSFEAEASVNWVFLRDQTRSGSDEQRRFVQTALTTPDFAILQGPPGSGKTTAICELICQLARQGKRVLLVASTHVAVDNVLENLIEWQDSSDEKLVMPIRIGDENRVSSEAIKPWTLNRLISSWRGEIRDFLDDPKSGSEQGNAARKNLKAELASPSHGFQRLVLEASNLVCGTTIGILQHPGIKKREELPPFDVMIIDEASKTTFSEFLVPALHACRWIVVGDSRQLSPYVEEMDLRTNLRSLCPDNSADALLGAFLASKKRNPEYSLIAVNSKKEASKVAAEANARGLVFVDLDKPDTHQWLPCAAIICGLPDTIQAIQNRLPGDLKYILGNDLDLGDWQARRRALATRLPKEDLTWASEVAWRLIRQHELINNPQEAINLDDDLEKLQPQAGEERQLSRFSRQLGDIKRVALPSILDILQHGAGSIGWDDKTVLTDGFPKQILNQRMVSLSYQHRMHPDISAFPRTQFYAADDLLHDAAGIAALRQWNYPRYDQRGVWIDAKKSRPKGNYSPEEADIILRELKEFVEWAEQSPKPDNDPDAAWDIAVLTFYRAQERELRTRLRKFCSQYGRHTSFEFGKRVRIKLATVDRFQGQEADLVFLSFVKSGSHGFLNSPSRLNVALTRARYQLVLVGHRSWMSSTKCRSALLKALANSERYQKAIGWVEDQ